jgi:hypothetical protein
MGLIVLMLVLQSVHNIVTWYQLWLGFVYYGSTSDEATAVFQGLETAPALVAIAAMEDLLATFRLAIADSIMVHPHVCLSPCFTKVIIGLEMLDNV